MIFSVIIPYSQDYPQVWFTVQDKYLRLTDNYTHDEYEVILVNNGSTGDHLKLARRMIGRDEDDPNVFTDHLSRTPSIHRRNLKYIEIPHQLHPKPAINLGAWKAEGKYHVHCDSHTLLNNNFFPLAEEFMDNNESCTVLHSGVSWNVRDARVRAYQYKLGITEEGRGTGNILGTWSTQKISDTPYRIAASGTCALVTRGETYKNRYRGYPSALRGYGGGEPYLDILAWMMGDEVYVHPDMFTSHFACTRSRGYHQGGPFVLARNNMLSWYILGGDKWAEVLLKDTLDRNAQRHPDWAPKFYEMYYEALKLGGFRRRWVEEHAVYTVDEVLKIFKTQGIYH